MMIEKNKKNGEGEIQEEDRSHLKVPKNQKCDNFDFYELSADISNSLTDKIYRQYLPEVAAEHKRRQEEKGDENLKNDLKVDEIATEIRLRIKKDLVESISEKITSQVKKELSEQYHSNPESLEYRADNAIKKIRWLLVPAFLSMVFVILCIVAIVIAETYHLSTITIEVVKVAFLNVESESQLTLKNIVNDAVSNILAILDLLLISSLVVMVMIGGYENSISRIGVTHEVPTWFGKLSISQLKVKAAASIVIISSIHLLMAFMQLDLDMKSFNYQPIMWTAIIHVVFVVSALILAYMDKISQKHN